MNRALNALRIDFMLIRSSLRVILIMYAISLVIGVATKLTVFTLGFAMVFGVFAAGTVFQVQEKNHLEKLYGILPLKKSEMILGRYLFGLALGIGNTVIAIALTLLVSVIRSAPLDTFTFLGVLSIAFLYFFFAIGVAFPIYLKFSFAKAYIFTMLPLYLVFLAAMLIAKKTDVLSNIQNFLQFFHDHMALMPVFGVIGGIALWVISMLVANLIYTRKEI